MTTTVRPRKRKAEETPSQRMKRETREARDSHLEAALLLQMRACRLPEPDRDIHWHATRDYHSEFGYTDARTKLLIEVDGGLNVGRRNRKQQERDAQEEALAQLAGVEMKRPPRGGGHASPDGYERDRIRDAEALSLGWTVLRVTAGMIERGEAVTYIERVLHAIWQRNGKKTRAA